MKRISFIALAFSCILGTAVQANPVTATQPTHPTQQTTMAPQQCHHNHMCYHHMKEMMQSLNLNADQQAKVKSIQDQLKQTQKANWEKMRSLRNQFRALIEMDNMDKAKLDALVTEKKEVYGTIVRTRAMAMHQIFHTLTVEQRGKFKEMMHKCEEQNKH